jgi:hypothetical protein
MVSCRNRHLNYFLESCLNCQKVGRHGTKDSSVLSICYLLENLYPIPITVHRKASKQTKHYSPLSITCQPIRDLASEVGIESLEKQAPTVLGRGVR